MSLFTGSSVAELGPSCDTYIILWSRLDRHDEDVALVGLLLVVYGRSSVKDSVKSRQGDAREAVKSQVRSCQLAVNKI